MSSYRFYTDWIRHSMRGLPVRIGDREIFATLAEVTRTIGVELGLHHMMVEKDEVYDPALGIELPSDCARLVMVSYQSSGSWYFVDLIHVIDIADRKYKSERGYGYAYVKKNTVFLSWTPETGFTLTLWYIPVIAEGLVTPADTLDGLGGNPHIVCGAALRFGALADLMFVHGITEADYAKATRWHQRYLSLIDRARETLVIKPRKHREQRNY